MYKTNRVVIVEGKYDKIRLQSVLDAMIITTEGFGIFNDRDKQQLLRKLSKERGLLVITDSDAAGFKIRGFLKGLINDGDIINAYIPDIFGKEGRKEEPSREGKLGVEGMPSEALISSLEKSGILTESANGTSSAREITTADLFEDGLTGAENSAEKRRRLLRSLDLPERLTGSSFLLVLNTFLNYEEYKKICKDLFIDSET